MEPLHNIKSRLSAVKNIGQITRAMEVVSANKMRKSQQIALSTRPYAFKALELLEKLGRLAIFQTTLSRSRKIKKTLLVIIASDRGLAGSFNTQVFKAAESFLSQDPYLNFPGHSFEYAAVGKKAEKFILKKNLPLAGRFYGFGDFIEPEEVEPLVELVIKGFEKEKWDRVITISMHFRTALKQEPLSRQVLPVDFEKIRETAKAIVPEYGRFAEASPHLTPRHAPRGSAYAEPKQHIPYTLYPKNIDYLFEPSAQEVLEQLFAHLVKMQIYHLVLEANASEHSARRVAMKNASDNADELFGTFTLQYNKARQAGITKEMVEITATQSALN